MKHIKFPKIGQFRNVVTDIKHAARFDGVDEHGDPIYNHDKLPVISFTGTVKLHGTNASVVRTHDGVLVPQSKDCIINITDNSLYGFYYFVEEYATDFQELFNQIYVDYGLNEKDVDIAIYGEWCGPGVQKGVALSQFPGKMFIIFGIKVVPVDIEQERYWLDHQFIRSTNSRISNTMEYPVYRKDIDFEQPKAVINELIDITTEVERECPVGKAHGVSGIGEGVVWLGTYKGNNYRFKVKGEKHSATKVKKLASVDPEKLANIKETVEYLVTDQRLDQAIQVTGAELDRKSTGDVMRWLSNDILSEELDTLNANSLSWKDIASQVTGEYRRLFFERIDNNL